MFGLILLSAGEGDCFFEDFIGTMPGGEMLQQLTDYLMENYIDPVLTQALGVSEQ